MAHSNACCGGQALSIGCGDGTVEFIDLYIGDRSIVLLERVFVFVEARPLGGGGPEGAIDANDCGVFANVGG